jgi:hypothetical protein
VAYHVRLASARACCTVRWLRLLPARSASLPRSPLPLQTGKFSELRVFTEPLKLPEFNGCG